MYFTKYINFVRKTSWLLDIILQHHNDKGSISQIYLQKTHWPNFCPTFQSEQRTLVTQVTHIIHKYNIYIYIYIRYTIYNVFIRKHQNIIIIIIYSVSRCNWINYMILWYNITLKQFAGAIKMHYEYVIYNALYDDYFVNS